MQQQGTQRLMAPRERVFAALMDARVLEQCIDGCERLVQTGEHAYDATVRAKVGPVQATFAGELSVHDIVVGERFRLAGAGRGGVAGFARGEASVVLTSVGDATELAYTLEATVGGKLAQLGSRLVEGTLRRMAETFFSRFAAIVGSAEAAAAETATETSVGPRAEMPSRDTHDGASTAVAASAEAGSAAAAGTAGAMVAAKADPSAGERYAASQQNLVWGVVFGILILALVLAAM